MQYASMEIEIEKQKRTYYQSLMNAQQHRGTSEEVINEWIIFFLDMLIATIRKLDDCYDKIKQKASYLNKRQKQLLQYITEKQPVKISDVISALPDFTSYTLKKDMQYLVNENFIKKMGKTRATFYVTIDKNT
jgi:Fic family protein